ncbi:hypothetical protein GCM10020220_109770 [Nonomuraea rubra]|uniref:hypothetical protein n=1 Tax=Nonomuraea rubra TaxID=46180 RepID=UPI0031E52832
MLKRTISMTAAGAALVVAAVAGCGSNAQPIQVNLAASEVLAQAAQKTAEVTSYTVDAVVNVSHPQEGAGKVQGRMLYQSKPQTRRRPHPGHRRHGGPQRSRRGAGGAPGRTPST